MSVEQVVERLTGKKKKREANETLKTCCISQLLVDTHHLIGGQTNVIKCLN